jgi:hypothetical protein
MLGVSFTIALISVFAIIVTAKAKGKFTSLLILNLSTGEVSQHENPKLQSFFAFSDFRDEVKEAPTHGQGYEIWRLGKGQQDNGLFAIDHLYYYPPGSQANGYVFYDGLVNGYSEYDQHWFPSTAEGDALFEESIVHPSNDKPLQWPWMVATLAALIFGIIAGFKLARRHSTAISQHSNH